MKITAVESYPVEATVKAPYYSSSGSDYSKRNAFLVRVLTDEGLEGWGETNGSGPTLAAIVKDVLAPLLKGADPCHTRTLWAKMQRAAPLAGPSIYSAISAVDIALWDLRGRVEGKSVTELLGAQPGGRFPAVATGIFYAPGGGPPEPRVERSSELVEAGYRGIKIKIGSLPPAEDVRHVAMIREAVGSDVMLCVDANKICRARTALRVARMLEELDVYWFEEPSPTDDVESYRAIAEDTSMYVAGGQNLALAESFLPLLSARALHFVQPNVAQVGGLTELDRLVAIAESWGAVYSPPGWGTGILIAAALQMRAATPASIALPFPDLDWIEYDVTENPLREGVLQEPLVPVDGYLEAPTTPGLGVEVDLEAVRSFAKA